MNAGTFAIGAVLALAVGLVPAAGQAATLLGTAQKMGQGTIRGYVELDAKGAPTAIGVRLGRGALDGLPAERNRTSRCFDKNKNGRMDHDECEGDLEFRLALPRGVAGRVDMPFSWIGVNWNPEGHPPKPWSVPHFDFHFYIASRREIDGIRVGGCPIFIDCQDRERALIPPRAKYVAPGHVSVGATVSRMGDHLIDTQTPEFAKPAKPFTHTWIYGAYDGWISFYEPMITMAFLRGQPDLCVSYRKPKAWAKAGYYPTKYCIRHDKRRGVTTISLEGMVYRQGE